jgi:hypothetical protein
LLKRDDGKYDASDHDDRSNHSRPPVTKSADRLPGHGAGVGVRFWLLNVHKEVFQTGLSRDAESAFWVMRMSQKRNAGFPFLEQRQPTRLHPNNFHFFGIQWLTTDISFVALRMHHLSA